MMEEMGNEKSGEKASQSSNSSDEGMSTLDMIAEITDLGDEGPLSTSAVLSACKQKILKPYLGLLALIGLRSFGCDGPNASLSWLLLSRAHLVQVVSFTVAGYVLQYLACFRRDRGFVCEASGSDAYQNVAFGLVLPAALHFAGYVYVLYLLRFKGTEQLENLMERTFLLSAHRANGRKAHLVSILWISIIVSILWVITSLLCVVDLLLRDGQNIFPSISSNTLKISLKVVLALAVLWQDIVQATVITSYCMQVQLLSTSLYYLREKLLQHTLQPLSWIREINECQNVLNYLNRDFSPGVCLFIFVDASWIISCVASILKNGNGGSEWRMTSIVVAGLWLVAVLAPFLLAARLNSSCMKLRHLGHEVRIRPFVYQDTPGEDLDTILLYTSTLRMKSKLFSVPIVGSYLFACFTLIALSALVAGQTCFFSF